VNGEPFPNFTELTETRDQIKEIKGSSFGMEERNCGSSGCGEMGDGIEPL
jgi:hypothetical protein